MKGSHTPEIRAWIAVVVGDRIRRERRERGWTQAILHIETGFSFGFLSDVENGRRGISVDSLLIFARAFGVPAGALVDDIVPPDEEARP